MKNKLILFLLPVMLLSSVSALLGAVNAGALSVFDNTYQTVDTLTIGHPDKTTSEIITTDYTKYITGQADNDNCTPSNAWEKLSYAMDHGSYTITQDDQEKRIWIFFTNSPTQLAWYNSGSYSSVHHPNIDGFIEIDKNRYGQTICNYSTTFYDGLNHVSAPSSNYYNFLTTAEPNYPDGYNGNEINGEYTPPPSNTFDMEYWINFSFINTTSGVVGTYINKNTNPVSDLADPPYVRWMIRDPKLYDPDVPYSSSSLVCESGNDRDEQFNSEIECPDFKPEQRKYDLVVMFPPSAVVDFDNLGYNIDFRSTVFTVDFSKPSTGDTTSCDTGAMGFNESIRCVGAKTWSLYDCISPNFPFLDVTECSKPVTTFLSILSFKTINFSSTFDISGCRNLTVLDDWLGKPNIRLCPAIPQYIRSTVTPFITFAIGLFTVRIITMKTRDY